MRAYVGMSVKNPGGPNYFRIISLGSGPVSDYGFTVMQLVPQIEAVEVPVGSKIRGMVYDDRGYRLGLFEVTDHGLVLQD